MKRPSYKSCVTGCARNAATFWRHLPDVLNGTLDEAVDVLLAAWIFVGYVIALLLTIIAPAFALLSPLIGWFQYRRAMRRYEAITAHDRKEAA